MAENVRVKDAELKREYKIVSEEDMMDIVINSVPIGRFVTYEGNRIVGCDNMTGDAWTEDFDTLEACEKWLFDEE